ncbi:MAG: DUF4349 domain-containing protein [Thermoleophilia bacterium]|nr:DUF4349 domain-containing protein [Thermoleophilia bacterium]
MRNSVGRTKSGKVRRSNSRGLWLATGLTVLVLLLAGLIGMGGCGGGEESAPRTTTAAAMWDEEPGYAGTATTAAVPMEYTDSAVDEAVAGTLGGLQKGLDQKIIADAQLEIEVERGRFQTVFTQALLLADRYGGYVVSSASEASGEEDVMKSGVVAIRIPVGSFDNAVGDAGGLGELKNQVITTQDVTEEYVDLEAHIVIYEARVDAMLKLMEQAETIDEILQVQNVLTSAQAELEALKGRLRYLEEHTSYSTITMTIYEAGVEVVEEDEGWGVVSSLKAALHNFVDAFNAIVRGLGILVPVLIVLAILALIVYLIWRRAARNRKKRQQDMRPPYMQYGWQQPGVTETGGARPGQGAPTQGETAQSGAEPPRDDQTS